MIGFLNIYKPSGMTSNKVITIIKKKFNISKIGHMGTLDPMACGVLPVAIGKATRMFDYFLDKQKTYIAHFEFGYTTDTLDADGQKTDFNNIKVTKQDLLNVLPQFVGKMAQIPPNFSAKNVGGTRAYKLARSGQTFNLKPKEIEIFDLQLLEQISDNKFSFLITCGSGTYIRSLGRDIAHKLGTFGCMTFLERTQSGFFEKQNSVQLENLDKIEDCLVPIKKVFSNIETINIDENICQKICNGVIINLDKQDGVYFICTKNDIVGIVEIHNKMCKLKTYLKD